MECLALGTMQILFFLHVYGNGFAVRPVSIGFGFLGFPDGFFGQSLGLGRLYLHDGFIFGQGFHPLFQISQGLVLGFQGFLLGFELLLLLLDQQLKLFNCLLILSPGNAATPDNKH
jgi:hypothetical protein